MNSLISPDDHWTIWTFLVGMAALSLYLEQKYKFVKKFTGAALAICAGILVSNIGLLPTESPSYDIVWDYIVPLVIPLLLIKTDVRLIFKETGRFAGAFHLSALGTIIGSIIAVAALHTFIGNLELIGPAMTASYIGGSINFVSVVAMFNPPKDLVNATLVADSGVMVIYFLFLITLPGIALARRYFPVTQKSIEIAGTNNTEVNKDYWKPRPIGLVDIGKSLAIAFIISLLSVKISGFFNGEGMPVAIKMVLGQQYLVLTTISILFPILFPKAAKNLAGNEELGTFFIFIFFVMIGLPASISKVLLDAPVMILFCAIILGINFLVTFILGKIFKYELEELILAAIITSGGPMSGVAVAISKNWHNLIFPSLMLGVWGYVIGNYLGYLMGIFLQAVL
ncbi:hypothetical protein MNBD_BACTEROID01-2282 [hydrothermal vent metagenome]|uniref:DUF819 domain-containing protein n=1 Tax=hydrothermal vent metagenome TaxID=652676 RepID=A0A3B0TZ83_9ZZZZ